MGQGPYGIRITRTDKLSRLRYHVGNFGTYITYGGSADNSAAIDYDDGDGDGDESRGERAVSEGEEEVLTAREIPGSPL